MSVYRAGREDVKLPKKKCHDYSLINLVVKSVMRATHYVEIYSITVVMSKVRQRKQFYIIRSLLSKHLLILSGILKVSDDPSEGSDAEREVSINICRYFKNESVRLPFCCQKF